MAAVCCSLCYHFNEECQRKIPNYGHKLSFVKHLTNSFARMESDCVFIGLVFSS